MRHYPSDVAFTPSVKAEQEKRGSRRQYHLLEEGRGWATRLTPDLAAVIAATRSFYMATASADGQPYIQYRGGPKGFLIALDETTLAFADYGGNRQYITIGNLAENPRAQLFLMDYMARRRVKIWGAAHVVEDDAELLARVSRIAAAAPERVIVFSIVAWDRNCNRHIPMLLPAEDVAAAVAQRDARIAELEAENERLRRAAR